MKKISFFVALLSLSIALSARAEPIRVGVSVTLSGDAATFGNDMKNAITMANDDFGKGRYELFIEDEKCLGKDAVTVAHKFIEITKIQYVVGFSCNQTLIPAAPLYQKAGVPVISGFGTSGDVKGLGDKVFRLFPADHEAIIAIFPYIAAHEKSVGFITEENEYPELMRRTFERLHKEDPKKFELVQENFHSGDTDLRQMLLRLKSKNIEALFINPNAEPSFIRILQQLEQIHYSPRLYSVYWPSASVVQEAVGKSMEGLIFANLPDTERLLSARGKDVLARFRKRFGEPNSVPYNVAFAYEALRVLDEAIKSGKPVGEYLHSVKVTDGAIGAYSFDSDGAVYGLAFELQQWKSGKIVPFAG